MEDWGTVLGPVVYVIFLLYLMSVCWYLILFVARAGLARERVVVLVLAGCC